MTNIFDQREVFNAQFEPDGVDFLYRKNSKGVPIRVSASERDRYVATFDLFLKYQKWGIGIGTVVLIATFSTYEVLTSQTVSDIYLYIGVGIIVLTTLLISYRVRNLPARELRTRVAVGPALTKSEIRERHAANMSYGQIASIILLGFVFPIISVRKYGVQSIWSILALAYCAFILAAATLLVMRKLRLRTEK